MSVGIRKASVFFGRGGIRGIALAGAAAAFEERGYRLSRVAGVSAGALVAALVAAGYRAAEIRDVVWRLDYRGMRSARGLGRLPGLGPLLAVLTRLGLYDGDALLAAFRSLLAAKDVRTFGDLRSADRTRGSPWPLKIIAADVTRGRVIVLPDDAPDYGVEPDALEVAVALRMSASVPFFFEPVRFGSRPRTSLVVDGGLLLRIPFALIEAGVPGDDPVFGVQAIPGEEHRARGPIRGPLSLLAATYNTALAANELCARSPDDAARTIDIDCGAVRAVDFGISDVQKAALYDAGRTATLAFLAGRAPAAAQAVAASSAIG